MSENSLVIRNATIVDGTGIEPFKGDVAIENGIIKENIDYMKSILKKKNFIKVYHLS